MHSKRRLALLQKIDPHYRKVHQRGFKKTASFKLLQMIREKDVLDLQIQHAYAAMFPDEEYPPIVSSDDDEGLPPRRRRR